MLHPFNQLWNCQEFELARSRPHLDTGDRGRINAKLGQAISGGEPLQRM